MKQIKTFLIILFLILFSQISAAQWVQIGLDTEWVSALAAIPDGAGGIKILAGTYGGIFYSDNSFTSWTSAASGLPKNINVSAFAVDTTGPDGLIILAATNRGTFLSSDHGTSWTPVDSMLKNINCFAVVPNGSGGSDIFAGAAAIKIFRSSDHGSTWTETDSGIQSCGFNMVAIVQSGNYLFACSTHRIWRSSNNGASWALVGSNFFTQPCGGYDSFHAALTAFPNGTGGSNLFVGDGLGGGLFFSTDNGESWVRANLGMSSISIYSFAQNGTNLFAGADNGVYLSNNFGTKWTLINTGFNASTVSSLAVSKDYLFAGTQSYGVWRLPLSDVSIKKAPNSSTNFKKYLDISILQSSTNVSFSFSVKTGSMEIYDIHGRFVTRLFIQDNLTTWQGNHIPGGYFARVVDGGMNIVKPFMVMR